MEKKTEYRKKVIVSKESYYKLKEIEKTLADRKYTGEPIQEFIDLILNSFPQSRIDSFIDERTPIEFKLNSMLGDPEKREALEALIKKSEAIKPRGRKDKVQEGDSSRA